MPDTSSLPAADTTAAKIRQYANQALAQKARVKTEQEQLAAIWATAAGDGLDKKVLQELVKRLDADEKTVRTHDELLDLYESAYRTAELRR